MKKLLTLFTLLLTVCSGAWADTDYYLINNNSAETASLNTTDFWTIQSLSTKSNGGDYKKCVILAGGVSKGVSNLTSPSKYIAYDLKTTATSITIKVYNTNSSDLTFQIYDVKEAANGATTATVTDKTAKKGELNTISYSATRVAGEKGTIYIAVPSSVGKIEFYQITASETGTALTNRIGGLAGYSVNFNKGRLATKGGETSKMDGITYYPSADSKPTNTAFVQLKSGNYIKFTTVEPVKLSIKTENAYKFYVATSVEGTTNETASADTHTFNLTTADTWYVVGGASSATQVSSLSISVAPVVTYDANGGSGSMSTTYFTVAANSFTAPTGKEFKEWNDDEGGNGTSYEVGDEIETSTTLYAIWQDAVADEAPTISIDSSADAAVDKGTEVTLTATITGHPTPTVQWYSNTVNNNTSGTVIDGATETTYSPSTTTGGTMYYYAKATNNFGGEDHVATSNVVSVVVNKSTACELTKVSYSNGFDAFIKLGDTNTITAYYIAGKDVPTINGVTISDYATYEVEGSTLTVTAEDGTTTKEFTITLSPVTPYSGTGTHDFDGTETWVKNVYGYSAADGWKISKPVEDNNNKRVSEGKCRMYFFMAPHTSLKMKNITNTRNVDVYKDGVKLETVEFTENTEKTMTIDADDACMIGFVNKGNGDAKFKYVTITKTGFVSGIITEAGWSTFSSSSALDLSTISGGAAYVATAAGENVTLTETSAKVEAGEGLMIKGTPNAAFKINTTNEDATYSGENLLEGLPTGGTVTIAGEGYYNYVFGWTNPAEPGFYLIDGDTPTLGANKAYLHTTTAYSGKLNIIIDDSTSQEEETDGIKAVSTKVENGVRYNLAGQKVGADYKGIVIVNGKKMLNK